MEELKNLVELKLELLDVIKEVEKEIEDRQIFTAKVLGKYGFNFTKGTTFLKSYKKDLGIEGYSFELLVNQINPNSVIVSQKYRTTENTLEFFLKSEEDLVKLLEQLRVL